MSNLALQNYFRHLHPKILRASCALRNLKGTGMRVFFANSLEKADERIILKNDWFSFFWHTPHRALEYLKCFRDEGVKDLDEHIETIESICDLIEIFNNLHQIFVFHRAWIDETDEKDEKENEDEFFSWRDFMEK